MSRHRFIRGLNLDDEMDDYYGEEDDYDRPAAPPPQKKVSKLAALAASRKAAQGGKTAANGHIPPGRAPTPASSAPTKKPINSPSSNTKRNSIEPTPQLSHRSDVSAKTPTLVLSNVQAEPTPFAQAIGRNGAQFVRQIAPSSLPGLMFPSPPETNGFSKPSPDDGHAPGQQFNGTASITPKTSSQSNRIADPRLTNDVKAISPESSSLRVKYKGLEVSKEYAKLEKKPAASLVVVGHVDSGKSTLMGRLLVDLGDISSRTMDKLRQQAAAMGKSSFAFAWVMDSTQEERSRGVTVDYATYPFSTATTSYTILDAPGHQDFVPNMIAAAAQADFAVLVVDSSPNSFESGFAGGGQTREHALLLRSMGVSRLVIAINKLDTAGWAEDRFTEIEQQMTAFLLMTGFQRKNLSFIPCSGLGGENVAVTPTATLMPWYKGPTLVQALESTKTPAKVDFAKPLRMTVNDVFRSGPQNALSVSGRIDSGTCQLGERIISIPSHDEATIRAIKHSDMQRDFAVESESVVLQLSDLKDPDTPSLKAGDILCSAGSSAIKPITSFTIRALAFDLLTPMPLAVIRGRLHVSGRITQLVALLDKATGEEAVVKRRRAPKVVQPQSQARLRIEVDIPVPLEAGMRIVLRAGSRPVAAGLVE